ncbi:hypothetical protein [Vibrio sp. EA2]|uniref:hypothetical protein n=1 Tax=Vibrio sp. EA2 TaxID=3079860 RepID=UPI00294971D6|nr:hypothetical protein [Vibrio sp. EA2]MDV6253465.1 hypothetical protein [Vibrio sp. EA2]
MIHSALHTAQYQDKSIRITLNKHGQSDYIKQRSPITYGLYTEVETKSMLLRFNLCNEIIQAQGRDDTWPCDQEYLKRTAGNDWVYYSTSGYAGRWETITDAAFSANVRFRVPDPYQEIQSTTGEYYRANLPYASNGITGDDPFSLPSVQHIITGWHRELRRIYNTAPGMPKPFQNFLASAIKNSPEQLAHNSRQLFSATGGRTSVLPPDTRHVDYNVIPLNISRGCLYKCRFCSVKNEMKYVALSRDAISEQIKQLTAVYGVNLYNYNAIFLGDHDALNVTADVILSTITEAKQAFQLHRSFMRGGICFPLWQRLLTTKKG